MRKFTLNHKPEFRSGIHILKIFFLSVHLIVFCFPAFTQQPAMPDSGRHIIYNWLRPIGAETYKITRSHGVLNVSINYYFEDRGIKVPLQAKLILSDKLVPSLVVLKGKPGRSSTISDSVIIEGGRAFINRRDTSFESAFNRNSFILSADVPITLLSFLIKFWEANGRPAHVHILPDNYDLEIKKLGTDTIESGNKKNIFHRYRIDRGKWMVRYLWMDNNGDFAAHAPGFGTFVNDKYGALLTTFRALTAKYGLSEFPVPKKNSTSQVITNVKVVDVKTGDSKTATTVVITDGKITWIGPREKALIPKGAKVIDAKGRWLLPGLWDMHAHYGRPDLGPAFVGMGITTVRDCANEFGFIEVIKKRIDEGTSIGPNILRAGLIDGNGPNTLGIITADNDEQAIAHVRNYKNAGYEQIKIYGSVKPKIVKAICDEAHRLGLTVTGHIPSGMQLSACIDSGMNAVNHINNVYNGFKIDTASQTIDFNTDANRIILEKIKSSQTVIDPTLCLFELTRRSLDTPIQQLYPNYHTWPKFLQAEMNNINLSEDTIRKYNMQAQFEGYKKLILKLFQEGVPVVAGTDLPRLPGHALYRELELYVSAGLTPLQAIQTATLIPAKVMNRLDHSGTIEVGKDADLILIDGDPLKQISDIRKVKWVFKDGQIYDAAALRNKVGFK